MIFLALAVARVEARILFFVGVLGSWRFLVSGVASDSISFLAVVLDGAFEISLCDGLPLSLDGVTFEGSLLSTVVCDDEFVDVVSCAIECVNVDVGKAVTPFVSTGIPCPSLPIGVLRTQEPSSDLKGKEKVSTNVSGVPVDVTFNFADIIWMR